MYRFSFGVVFVVVEPGAEAVNVTVFLIIGDAPRAALGSLLLTTTR